MWTKSLSTCPRRVEPPTLAVSMARCLKGGGHVGVVLDLCAASDGPSLVGKNSASPQPRKRARSSPVPRTSAGLRPQAMYVVETFEMKIMLSHQLHNHMFLCQRLLRNAVKVVPEPAGLRQD